MSVTAFCADLGRFYESPPSRFIVTDLDSATLTFLDRLAHNISLTRFRTAAMQAEMDVPSDNPEINIEAADGSGPFVEEGVRLLYGFFRECGATPWIVRFGGIILSLEDRATTQAPVSHLTAYDPWKLLYRRPILDPDLPVPDLPGPEGLTYVNTRGSDMILQQLDQMNVYCAGTPLDNAGLDWGWSGAPYGGTLEDTPVIEEINFQRGASIGEMIDQLVATGTLDIRIDPIYDIVDRPGLVGEFSIFNRVGEVRTGAVFGWDVFPKNAVGLTRLTDGNLRANILQYFAGMGGPPVVPTDDVASQNKYGIYFEQRFWPQEKSTAAVEKLSERAIALIANGQFTYTLAPAAERAPIPFLEYDVGDMVPVYTSNRFRREEDTYLRIESIPIVIGDDQLARINGLLVATDEQPDFTSGNDSEGRPGAPNQPADPGDLNAGDDPPSLVAARVLDSALTLEYNVGLNPASVPATTAFAVVVGGIARGVNSVSISGQTVTLTLASAVTAGATTTVAYTQPASNRIESVLNGADAASFGATSVDSGSAGGGGGTLGSGRSILTYRVTGVGGDSGDGIPGRTYHWLVGTSGNTPRTNGGNAGRYFVEGDGVWRMILGIKPASSARLGRVFNWHDMPFSGYIWGSVSPVAHDRGSTAETEGNTVGDWFTLQYVADSDDKHTSVPFIAGEWNWEFVEIVFHRSAGSVKVWLRNSARGAALGPLVDLSGIRTLNPDTRFYPGVQFWQGIYISQNYYGSPIQCDFMAAMVGRTWDAAWKDTPTRVTDFGSPGSSYSAITSVSTSDILLPSSIAAQISA